MRRLVFGLSVVMGCSGLPDEPQGFVFDLPAGFPAPQVPEDNPMSEAKVALGRRLFYDKNLSKNRTQSCGSCHIQSLAFTDGRQNAIGSTGELHRRNAQGLVNVAYNTSVTWANPFLTTLESQALIPFFANNPVELGFTPDEDEELLQRLRDDPEYIELFAEAFPGEEPSISLATLSRALTSFQRVLISGGSPYDRFLQGELNALSEPQRRGMDLFLSERLECNHCHGGFNLSDAVKHEDTTFTVIPFHNTGLYNIGGTGDYPSTDTGVFELTGRAEDMGRFKAPSLRNIALTAPYMHDGSIATLSEVLDHYAAGGRARAENNGEFSPFQSSFVFGFTLTEEERQDILSFFEALTDQEFLTDPRFSDPFSSAP